MIFCEICNVKVSGARVWDDHVAGRAHQRKVQATSSGLSPNQPKARNYTNIPPNPTSSQQSNRYAPLTWQPQSQSHSRAHNEHNQRPKPAQPQIPYTPEPYKNKKPSRKQKQPKRSYDVDFGVIRNTERTNWKSILIPRDESVMPSEVVIEEIKPSRKESVEGFRFNGPVQEPTGYRIYFGFDPLAVRRGVHVVLARLEFGYHNRVAKTLKIKAITGSPEDHNELKPIAEYEGPLEDEQTDDWHRDEMIRGRVSLPPSEIAGLPFYDIPKSQFQEIQKRYGENAIIYLRSLLPYTLETGTYGKHWSQMLWHEEIALGNALKRYDMEHVVIKQVSPNQHSLGVEGLSEKRPSVIVSDLVAIRPYGVQRPVYGGSVTEVQKASVILQLHQNFPGLPGQLWDTRFTVNRLVLRRMHDSINKAHDYERVLFPDRKHQKPRMSLKTHLRLGRRIGSNAQQTLAVERIVRQTPGDTPFIIFGPPGTGKTTVVVEAISQVLEVHANSRVLVCAPSNSATDLIAIRLAERYGPSVLIRLYSPSRSPRDSPSSLLKYSAMEGGRFNSPSKSELMKYRIVVCTCAYASIPRAMKIHDHFTHIFVDEAGHASEPEIMIPILQNVSKSCNVVISGDPMQLGPIIESKPCRKLGMDVSYLERLMKRSIYDTKADDVGDRNVVKLLQNYRSHDAILSFSNHAFYDGELECCADPVLTSSLDHFDRLPQEGFPIIFHSICGENQQEGKSPSYFNIDEATLVKHYVKDLLSNRKHSLTASQIGVVTPYRQQSVKIRELLKKEKYEGVEVKVTEDWQGQEKRVIIISTVRSDPELLEEGALTFLGFVTSWRRTNVALTRAQALMIVIGNGHILELDPVWSSFLKYVHRSGGWEGDTFSSRDKLNINHFDGLRKADESYMDFIDRRWDGLLRASKGWEFPDE